jgi:hypothetical protein
MRTFVVRVYRPEQKTPSEPVGLTGLVEEVSTGVQAMFYDADGLLAILNRAQPETTATPAHSADSTPSLRPIRVDITDSAQPRNEGEGQ